MTNQANTTHLDASERAAIRRLIESEVIPATGCTEPIAVAFAAARARRALASVTLDDVETVSCRLSANIIKNAMGVGIPGTGMIGLPIAVALGVTMGDDTRALRVIEGVTPQQVADAHHLIDTGAIAIHLATEAKDPLHIDVEVGTPCHTARVLIEHTHTGITGVWVDGQPTAPDTSTPTCASNQTCGDDTLPLNMATVWDYAMTTPVEDLEYILDAARLNAAASTHALRGGFGHEIGATLLYSSHSNIFGNTPFARIMARTASACDARMGGAPVPVMSNSGSGNQGIAATMPVVAFADENGTDTPTLIRALILSHLTVIYIKQSLGRLSALCGCVVAATGSTAAICFLMGGSYTQVCASIKNMVANLTGMICDGAKPSCSLKLTSAVSTAMLSAIMAIEDRSVTSLEGIIDDDVDRTIRNLTDLGRDAMAQTDQMILKIMTSK